MIKKFLIEGLDCANCARELEEEISKVVGVNSVKISFIVKKITLDIDDEKFDDVLNKVKVLASKFEDGVEIK